MLKEMCANQSREYGRRASKQTDGNDEKPTDKCFRQLQRTKTHIIILQTNQGDTASREALRAEVALLHTHIATSSHDDRLSKVDILQDSLATLLQTFSSKGMPDPFVAWARVTANSAVMRKIFIHLSRGVDRKGATKNMINGLAAREMIRQ